MKKGADLFPSSFHQVPCHKGNGLPSVLFIFSHISKWGSSSASTQSFSCAVEHPCPLPSLCLPWIYSGSFPNPLEHIYRGHTGRGECEEVPLHSWNLLHCWISPLVTIYSSVEKYYTCEGSTIVVGTKMVTGLPQGCTVLYISLLGVLVLCPPPFHIHPIYHKSQFLAPFFAPSSCKLRFPHGLILSLWSHGPKHL